MDSMTSTSDCESIVEVAEVEEMPETSPFSEIPDNDFGIAKPTIDFYNERVKYCNDVDKCLYKELVDARKRYQEANQTLSDLKSKRMKLKQAVDNSNPLQLLEKTMNEKFTALDTKLDDVLKVAKDAVAIGNFNAQVYYNRRVLKDNCSVDFAVVPFLVGQMPDDLPRLTNYNVIEKLTDEQVDIYLTGYGQEITNVDPHTKRTLLEWILAVAD